MDTSKHACHDAGVDNEEGWQRLAEAVKRRRGQCDWTQLDVYVQGGPSIDRIQAIESVRTDSYSARTISKLERGLGWEPGSVRAVLAGGEPTPIEVKPPVAPARPPTVEELAATVADLQRKVDELIGEKWRRNGTG
jgi:hypothetical protein